MSEKKYELSLWRDYTSQGIVKEEKVKIISAHDMEFVGRAQNIIVEEGYTGLVTMTFEVLVNYFSPLEGKFVRNPFIDSLKDKSKLKLWINEHWFNQFHTNNGDGTYTGEWEDGRWYDFVINNYEEKRSKKQLIYNYSCTHLYINELSRTGYKIEFSDEEDGIGTVHSLSEKILSGTDWEYVQTETFPDYEEVYSIEQGKVIKNPIKTIQTGYLNDLNKYASCYKFVPNQGTKDAIEDIFASHSLAAGQYGYEADGTFYYYRNTNDGNKRKYVYGYNETNIVTTYAPQSIISNNEDFSSLDGWKVVEEKGSIKVDQIPVVNGTDTTFNYKLLLTNNSTTAIYCNNTCQENLKAGDLYLLKVKGVRTNVNITFNIYDKEPTSTLTPLVVSSIYEGTNNLDKYFWIQIPCNISTPYFAISLVNSVAGATSFALESVSLSLFTCYSDSILASTQAKINALSSNNGLVDNLGTINFIYNGEECTGTYNNNSWHTNLNPSTVYPLYITEGTVVQNDYSKGIDRYLIETYLNGVYTTIYIYPLQNEVSLIEDYSADKRRILKEEKSNRFNLLQSTCELFKCFLRFNIKHNEDGTIYRDSNGKQIKQLTMVSQIGRNQFNGFNYGVNLDSISRKIESENLVTKMYVEPIENSTTGELISIQQSQYSKIKENFMYDFEYYLGAGLIEGEQFEEDYGELTDYLSLSNANLFNYNKYYNELNTKKTSYDNKVYSYEILMKNAQSEANKILSTVKWNLVQGSGSYSYETDGLNFPNIPITKLTSADEAYNHGLIYKYAKYCAEIMSLNNNGYLPIDPENISNNWSLIYSYQTTYQKYLQYIIELEVSLYGLNKEDYFMANDSERIAYRASCKANPTSNSIVGKLNNYLSSINTLIKDKNTAISVFENKYSQFIIEGNWSATDYIDNDALYLDACSALVDSAMPKVSYTISVIDLSHYTNPIDKDNNEKKDFVYQVGDNTYIGDEELFGIDSKTNAPVEQYSILSSKKMYVDINKPDDITLQNYETRFEELFSKISATVISLKMNEGVYGRAANFESNGTINANILQETINKNNDFVYSANGGSVITDDKGILIKDKKNGAKQVRIIDTGIFLSKDGGNNWTSGMSADGVNASTITAGEIDTGVLKIRNSNVANYIWDSRGISAFNTYYDNGTHVYTNKLVRYDQYGIYFTKNGEMFGNNWWVGKTDSGAIDYIQTNSTVSLTWMGFKINAENGLNRLNISSENASIYVEKYNGSSWNKVFGIDSDGYVYTERLGTFNSSSYATFGNLRIYSGTSYDDIKGAAFYDKKTVGSSPFLLLWKRYSVDNNNSAILQFDAKSFNISNLFVNSLGNLVNHPYFKIGSSENLSTNDDYIRFKNNFNINYITGYLDNGNTIVTSNRLKCNATGGVIYGNWAVGADYSDAVGFNYTKFTPGGIVSSAISARNAFYIRDESSTCGSIYKSTGSNVVINSENGNDLYLSISGNSKLAIKSSGGYLWGDLGISGGLGVSGNITTNGCISNGDGNWLNDVSEDGGWHTKLGCYDTLDVVGTRNQGWRPIRAASFDVTSNPKYKKNIVEYKIQDAINRINQLKFYSYDMKGKYEDVDYFTDGMSISEAEGLTSVKMGIMTTESPDEIVTKDAEGIDLYSYVSLCARAIQEISEILGGLINGTETNS